MVLRRRHGAVFVAREKQDKVRFSTIIVLLWTVMREHRLSIRKEHKYTLAHMGKFGGAASIFSRCTGSTDDDICIAISSSVSSSRSSVWTDLRMQVGSTKQLYLLTQPRLDVDARRFLLQ